MPCVIFDVTLMENRILLRQLGNLVWAAYQVVVVVCVKFSDFYSCREVLFLYLQNIDRFECHDVQKTEKPHNSEKV